MVRKPTTSQLIVLRVFLPPCILAENDKTRVKSSVIWCSMRLVVIDNYDSFTYNLVHLLAEICQEAPLVVKNDEISWNELRKKQFDGIVISPGPGRPDLPDDFGLCKNVIEEATVPLLGVCLGHQGIGALSGGLVVRAPEPMHGRTSLIHHSASGNLWWNSFSLQGDSVPFVGRAAARSCVFGGNGLDRRWLDHGACPPRSAAVGCSISPRVHNHRARPETAGEFLSEDRSVNKSLTQSRQVVEWRRS